MSPSAKVWLVDVFLIVLVQPWRSTAHFTAHNQARNPKSGPNLNEYCDSIWTELQFNLNFTHRCRYLHSSSSLTHFYWDTRSTSPLQAHALSPCAAVNDHMRALSNRQTSRRSMRRNCVSLKIQSSNEVPWMRNSWIICSSREMYSIGPAKVQKC